MKQENNITAPGGQLLADFPAQIHSGLQFATPMETQAVQSRLFMEHFHYTLKFSPFYRDRYAKAGINPLDIKSLSDLETLPLTTKDDLGNAELFYCADPKAMVDICLTSATSGSSATIIPLTAKDIARLAYNEELALDMAGINETDTLLVCAAMDRCFMAGMAYFMGGLKLSARMVRAGTGSAAQHWELIQLTNATAIVGVPSLMYKIGNFALEQGHDPGACCIKKLIAIGEPTKNKDMELLPIARELEAMWDAKIFSTYASSEMATTFCECETRAGGHLRPELLVVEILDDDGKPVAQGEIGEVVVTPLGVTGMPLIRFQTGDISYFLNDACGCGRTTPRLAPVIGRKNQMLKYKGTTIFPNAILSVLEGDDRFYDGYIEVKKNQDGTDRVCLFAALTNHKSPVHDNSWIQNHLRAKLRVVPEIQYITPEQADKKINQFHKKRKRLTFFDLR